MTTPCPETLEREDGKLFLTDAELIRRLGVPERLGYSILRMMDADPKSGFPKKERLWGDRRYWPAVAAYLDATLVPRYIPTGAARLATENRDLRSRLPRQTTLTELARRRSRHDLPTPEN
jgi:hypothetical protein